MRVAASDNLKKKKHRKDPILHTPFSSHDFIALYPLLCCRKKNCYNLQDTMSWRKRQCISFHRKPTVLPLCCFTSLNHFMALFHSNIVLLEVHSIPNSIFKCSWLMLNGCSVISSGRGCLQPLL